jgi:hypothetical protein
MRPERHRISGGRIRLDGPTGNLNDQRLERKTLTMGPGPIRENNSYHREVKDGTVASAPGGAKCGA